MATDPNHPITLDLAEADPKPWYRSRTILGALMVVASQAAALAGIPLDPGALTELATTAVSLLGGVLAIYGRIKAEQPVSLG